ncbi:MAG: DUF72 domain-containing protein [Rubrivivax sp.]
MSTTLPPPDRHSPIRVGIGGWTYEPWRGVFYPKGLPQAQELHHASRLLTAIEINGTYYGTQKRSSFAKWRDETPDDFVFSLKASRYATNRRVLAEAGDSIDHFIGSGLAELGPKLGPIVWQFAPTKRFDADDFEAFLARLPAEVEGIPLRHVMDVRHESFACSAYVQLARRYRASTVFTHGDGYPAIGDLTGPVVYLRLMQTAADVPTGYAADALDAIARCAEAWSAGYEPADLPRVEPVDTGAPITEPVTREVYVYFISGAKERAPAAAQALIQRLPAPA